jgi:LysM repeat protein
MPLRRAAAWRRLPVMGEPGGDAAGGVPYRGYGRARGPDVCPHLRSLEGPWRVQHASRDHRCALLARDARLDTAHQRAYCLTAEHRSCPVNVPEPDLGSRRLVATSPVLVERRAASAAPVIRDAARGGARVARWAIAGAVVVAVLILFLLAWGPLSGSPAASGTPGASGVVAASGSAAPSRTPAASRSATTPDATASTEATASSGSTPRPSVSASPKPTATARRTYTVKSGDTLYEIAVTYGTTVEALKQLNKLTSSTLHPGQVLRIP